MIKFYFEQRPWALQTAAWIVKEDSDGNRFVAKPTPIMFEKHDPSVINEPTLLFSGMHALNVLEELRASLEEHKIGKSSDLKEIEAVKYHLEDMRRLVFRSERGDKI